MTRTLNTETLDAAARHYAAEFLRPGVQNRRASRYIAGREYVEQDFYNFVFKDEFEYLFDRIRGELGSNPLAEFEAMAAEKFAPRDDAVFAALLAEKLAIDPDGNHIEGLIGTTVVGGRSVGRRLTRHGDKNASWRIYAGEEEERALGNVRELGKDGPGVDPLPPEGTFWPDETAHLGLPSVSYALNTNVSIAFALAALDPALLLFDEGTVDGVIEGRTGAQPVDPDAVVTGVLLFSLDMGTPGFAAAADQAPDAEAAASAIADDVSADATNTLSYCRASSANVLITPLNDHIDGEAGTSGADFNFNTLAIVIGATVSMTAWTVRLPQGPTAT